MTAASLSLYDTLLTPQIKKLAPFYALIFAVMLCYGDIYDNDFLYDDKYLILKNSFLQSWHSFGDIFRSYVNSGAYRNGHFYRPLQNVVYLILYQSVGPSLFAFHLLNLTLHAANACLVYALGRKLSFNPWAVFFAALIWALHPVNTEAVTYMSATADTLYSFFCLLGILVLLPDFTSRKILIAIPLFVLGLLSKEAAIIFPALAVATLYLVSKKRLNLKIYLCTWPLWAVAIAYLAIRFTALPFGMTDLLNTDPISRLYGTHILLRLSTFLATIPAYLGLLVWPVGLHMDRDFKVLLDPWHPEFFAGLLILFAAAIQIIWGRGMRGLSLSWGFLWFVACHFPQTGLLVPVNSLFLEHWMYLPSAGLALGVGQTLAQTAAPYLRRPEVMRSVAALLVMIVLAFGFLTYKQNKIWHDALVFYANILNRGETSVRARNNLGIAYMDQGMYGMAMEQFHAALKDHDLTPETHQNIAALLAKRPDGREHTQQEIDELQSALAIDSSFAPAYDSLADIYNFKGEPGRAALYKKEADTIRKRFIQQ